MQDSQILLVIIVKKNYNGNIKNITFYNLYYILLHIFIVSFLAFRY